MTSPTRPSWDPAPFPEAPLAAAPAGAPERLSGLASFHYLVGVTWLVIVLSGVMPYLNDITHANLFYPFVGVFIVYFLLFRLNDLARVAYNPQFWLWSLTALLPILLFVTSGGGEWARVSMRIRIIFFSTVAGSALILLDRNHRRMLRTAALITLAWAIPVNFFEVAVPNVFSTADGRSAGLYQNPNDSSAALLLCLLLSIDLRRLTVGSVFLMSAGLAAVVTTYSRAGITIALLLWAFYLLAPRARGGLSSGRRILVVGAAVVGLVVAGVVVAQNVHIDAESLGRLRSIFTGDVSDLSAQGRFEKAQRALDIFLSNFWTGNGLGSVERLVVAPHNSFLYLAVDYGIAGVLLYAALLFVPVLRALLAGWKRSANALALALMLIYFSLFTHYVHGTDFFGVAFGALIADALVDPRPQRRRARPAEPPSAVGYGVGPA